MVLRKPMPQSDNLVPRPLSAAVNNPPYPTTPSTEDPPVLPISSEQQEVYSPDLNTSPAFRLRTLDDAQKKKEKDDDESDYSLSDWDQSDDEDSSPEDFPDALKVAGGRPLPTTTKNSLPDALRAGPLVGTAIKKQAEPVVPEPTGASASSLGAISNGSGSIPLQTNNPYLRMQNTGQSDFGAESSQQVWGGAPSHAQKYGELVELPSMQTPVTPTNGMSKLTLNSNVPPHQGPKSPNQPPLIAVESATPQSAQPKQESNNSEARNSGIGVSSSDAIASSHEAPSNNEHQQQSQDPWQDQQVWDKLEKERKQSESAAAQQASVKAKQEQQRQEEIYRTQQITQFTPSASPFEEEQPPALPPRRSHEQEELPPQMPPRPLETGVVGSSAQVGPESPTTVMNRQRKEHYQIKHIRWYDANARGIRTSPILTQNLNGPCPLLALVNALVLSTPATIETALVETLRTREQVSLGLLLDAVFDELMSGRRGGAAQELPDVSELYKFLLTLHTGLNVNPMYVQDPGATDGSSTLVPSRSPRPGGFENSREMRLYRTFNIPLIHGWLPNPGSDAYVAFERVAKTYEDAQHVQFQEEELDAKLQTEGLNAEEQRMFTDIHAIKEFLMYWPTQLTDYGLRAIRESIRPGQIGILFRNDHFSTIYKDPRTSQIFSLVTDAGYSSHDEIVWESLVDVHGQGSELYSGDFRAVGNNSIPQRQQTQQPVQSLLDIDDDQGWTTVGPRSRNQQTPSASTPVTSENTGPTPKLSKEEQEDHDLALALQLQEEEEDRHRRSLEERRRRENQLSQDTIAAQAQSRPNNRRTSRQGENPPLIPPRRNNIQTHRPNNEPAPPPTYEEAATNPPYHPPQGHPANPNAPIHPQGSAYMQNSSQLPPGHSPQGRRNSRPMGIQNSVHPRPGRRQSAGVGGPNGVGSEDRDKCVVM